MSALETFIGECPNHGWHGKTVCPHCREVGHVALHVLLPPKIGLPRRYGIVYVSQSLLRFRGGGREKLRQEARCRMCLRPRGPETVREWNSTLDDQHNYIGSRPLTRHHLIPENWFKYQLRPTRAVRSVDANIVPLCRPCHDEVERDAESRRMLRRVLGSDEVSLVIQLAGEEWLNERYPK